MAPARHHESYGTISLISGNRRQSELQGGGGGATESSRGGRGSTRVGQWATRAAPAIGFSQGLSIDHGCRRRRCRRRQLQIEFSRILLRHLILAGFLQPYNIYCGDGIARNSSVGTDCSSACRATPCFTYLHFGEWLAIVVESGAGR